MSQKELLDYIQSNLKQGFKREQLKTELLKAGWEENMVDEAFHSLEKKTELPKEEKSKPADEKENFLDRKDEFLPSNKDDSKLEVNNVKSLNSQIAEKSEELNESKSNLFKSDLNQDNKEKKNKKAKFRLNSKLKIVILALLALIILFSASFYIYNRFQNSPMKVLQRALLKMEKIESFHYSLEITGEYEWESGDFSNLIEDPLMFLGFSDQDSSSGLPPSRHQMIASFDGYSASHSSDNFDSWFGLSFWSDEMKEGEKIALEARLISNDLYLKLDLPKIENIDISFLDDQWINFSSIEGLDDFIFSEIESSQSEQEDVQEPSRREELLSNFQDFKDLALKRDVFKITDVYPSFLSDGQKSYHYILDIDKYELADVLLEISSKDIDEESLNYFTEKDRDELKSFLESIELISGEMVVGRDDFLIYQIDLDLKFDENLDSNSRVRPLNFSLSFNFFDFDQIFEVIIPEDSLNIMDLMIVLTDQIFDAFDDLYDDVDFDNDYGQDYNDWSEIISADSDAWFLIIEEDLLGDVSKIEDIIQLMKQDSDSDGLSDYEEIYIYGTDPLNPDTDGDGLSDYEEIYIYGTDPLNPDTDGDGYLDGEEVLHGYNPLGDGLLSEIQIPVDIYHNLSDSDISKIQAAANVRDYQRVNDVKYLQTLLEMYYLNNNGYPEDLNDFIESEPPFLSSILQAPVPADGDCDLYDNSYSYSFIADSAIPSLENSYTLRYCLGNAQGSGTSAGINIATPFSLSSD